MQGPAYLDNPALTTSAPAGASVPPVPPVPLDDPDDLLCGPNQARDSALATNLCLLELGGLDRTVERGA